jgi:hypothetical protein
MAIDKSSETWEEIERFIDAQMVAITSRLLLRSTDINMSQYLRGSYVALNDLKQLPDKKEVPLVNLDTYI